MGIAGLPPPTVQKWISTGLLRLDTPGHGHRRRYPPAEVSAARALDYLRRLGGITPPEAMSTPAQRRLQVAVANAARNNPPGTVVEIPSPVSWVRTVVIVPEP